MVYILEDDPRKNFISAQRYGELYPIFKAGVSVGLVPDDIIDKLAEVCEQITEHDFVVPTGDPVIMLMFGLVLGNYVKSTKILKWDRQNNQYFPIQVTL